MTNFQAKLPGYATGLGLTPAQLTAAEGLCEAFIGAVQSTKQAKTSMQAMTQWRDDVLYGVANSSATPQAPVFPVVGPTTYPEGVVRRFMKLGDLIVASPGYAEADSGFGGAGVEG